jgi:hypothetical protein
MMRSTILAFLLLAGLGMTGCTTQKTSARVDPPHWQMRSVTGSRIRRTVDSRGSAITGHPVKTITRSQVESATGTLSDKLGGAIPGAH